MARPNGRAAAPTNRKRRASEKAPKARRSKRVNGHRAKSPEKRAVGSLPQGLSSGKPEVQDPKFESAPDWQQNLVQNLIKQGYTPAAARSVVKAIAA